MKPRSDEQLLQAWSKDRCEESFRALADRYADLVYGTAARRMADRHLAEEVAQNVFITLAKKAGQLKGENGIGGWLFKATVLEAAGFRRSKSRRDQRMRELNELEEALRRVGGEAMAGSALEIVDEGLAGLGAADREVLVPRFFKEASYEEMAHSGGRSEAACRKQVSRALQKLAEVLAGRGVRVSTTVLAAGLGTLMTTKAPAALAGTCARGANSASVGAAAPGISTTLLTAMTTSKITSALAIGGVLILVTTGAGYMVGRSAAKKEVGGVEENALAVHASPSKKSRARGEEPRVGARAGRGRGTGAEVTRVAAILNALKDELRGKRLERALEVGPPLVEDLSAADMAEVFKLLEGEGNESLRQTLKLVLYGHWGKLAGAAAADHAIAESPNLRQAILNQVMIKWAGSDPAGAIAWQNDLLQEEELPLDEFSANRIMGTILRGWAQTDMDAAWDQFELLGPDQQQAALKSLDSLIGQPELRDALGTRVGEIKDETLRSLVAEEVGESWSRIDPKAAAEWFSTLRFEDPMLRLRAAMEIWEGWFRVDVAAAATWMWPMVPEEMQGKLVE